jgi:hypothetical protein
MSAKVPRVTIFGKQVRKIEMRAGKFFAIFDDSEMEIAEPAARRISERMAGASGTANPQSSISNNSPDN